MAKLFSITQAFLSFVAGLGLVGFGRDRRSPREATPREGPDEGPKRHFDIDEYIDKEVLSQVDAATTAADDRTVNADQRRRHEVFAEMGVQRQYLPPPTSEGADGQLLRRQKGVDHQVENLAGELARDEEALAVAERAVPPKQAPPAMPLSVFGVIVVYSLSVFGALMGISPFSDLAAENLRSASIWAGLCSLIVGATAVGSTFGLELHKEGDTPVFGGIASAPQWLSVAGGLAILAGISAARFANAVTANDVLTTVAWGTIDLGALLLAKYEGHSYRRRLEQHRREQAPLPAAARQRDLARTRVESTREKYGHLLLLKADLDWRVDERAAHTFNLEEKKQIARSLAGEVYERRVQLNVLRGRSALRGNGQSS